MIMPQRHGIVYGFFLGAIFGFALSLYFVRPYHADLNAPAPPPEVAIRPSAPPVRPQLAASEPVAPAPAASVPAGDLQLQEITLSHWIAAQDSVNQARAVLAKARTGDKDGHVEKGLAQLEATLTDIDAAIAYSRAHAEPLRVVVSAKVLTIGSGIETYSTGTTSPNLRKCLGFLKTALDEAQQTPNDAGGFHDRVIADIAQAGSETILGLKYADGVRGDGLIVPF